MTSLGIIGNSSAADRLIKEYGAGNVLFRITEIETSFFPYARAEEVLNGYKLPNPPEREIEAYKVR